MLPHATHVANPVDLTVGAEPGDFATAVRELLRETAIDAVVVLFIPLAENDPELVLDAVEQAADRAQKPVVAAILDADGQPPRRSAGRVPNFRLPEACVGRAGPRRRPPRLALAPARPARPPARHRARTRTPAGRRGARRRRQRRRLDATPRRSRRCWTPTAFRVAPTARCRDPDAAVAAAARLRRSDRAEGEPAGARPRGRHRRRPARPHRRGRDPRRLAGAAPPRQRHRLPVARRGRRTAAARRRRRHPRRLGHRPRPRPAARPRRRRPAPRADPRHHLPPRPHHRRRRSRT